MDKIANGGFWGQLVCVTDIEMPPVPINKCKYTIGRAKGNDLSFPENKLISGNHCYLERDNSGKVWLCDTSTNGTLVNMNLKLNKGKRQILHHGDEFFVVFKKNDPDLNVGYMYQDMKELAEEQNSDDESTQLYDNNQTLTDEDLNLPISPASEKKRSFKDDTDKMPPTKKLRSEELSPPEPNDKQDAVKVERDPCRKDIGNEDQVSSRLSVEEKTEAETKEAQVKAAEEKTKETDKCEEKTSENESDAMAESLTCIICQEILHDCISLQPCMHSFCAGCYSDWMAKSNQCPSCRMKVERINKNHLVNNLVEAFLKEHPDRKRPEEDIKELEQKNKITRDMLYPGKEKKKKGNCGSDCEGCSECSGSSDSEDFEDSHDSNDDLRPPVINPQLLPAAGFFGWAAGMFGTVRPTKTVCRQCPEYKETIDASTKKTGVKGKVDEDIEQSTSGDVQPSSSKGGCADGDGKIMPVPPKYVCTPDQLHVLCRCCLQPMPCHRYEKNNTTSYPPQHCDFCQGAFCHAYWGCRKIDCLGCLSKFKDMNFGKKVLNNIVLNNATESNILKNYLEERGISVKDMLLNCLQKLDEGKYSCVDQMRHRIDSNTFICFRCGLRNLKDLAYQYRKDIPRDQLPAIVTSRPDCYWGRHCRTQINKPHHAERFNHICDQTRTT